MVDQDDVYLRQLELGGSSGDKRWMGCRKKTINSKGAFPPTEMVILSKNAAPLEGARCHIFTSMAKPRLTAI